MRYYVMQWTDRIRHIKIILLVAAVFLAVMSLAISHYLVRDLYAEERGRMEIWAEAMRTLGSADSNTDIGLVLRVIDGNNTIPVIVTDANGSVQTFRNVTIRGCSTNEDSLKYVSSLGRKLFASGRYIRIGTGEADESYDVFVCYDDSTMLKRLSMFPYVQLGVVAVFVIVAIFALLTSKRAEQDKVWVGLSKETAHQLGTPISSLMAWTEVLKETYPDDELLPEMGKDVQRLQLIADRFSKIGSRPETEDMSVCSVVGHAADYMDRRTSSRVKIVRNFPEHDVKAKLNASLFEWVIENLCKNAVDAMTGDGVITLTVIDSDDKVILDVADTGKGIKRKDLRSVFTPGFTTKKRGWGLGLSLARRIVEEYHNGRIYVKSSEVGKGTTFRIELRR